VGATATASAVDPDPRPAKFRDTPGERGYSSEASETLWGIPRRSEGQPFGTGQVLSGTQNCRLSRPEKPASSYMLVSQFFG
jgi:hypothetical protein